MFSPEWQSCKAAGHDSRDRGCYCRTEHYYPQSMNDLLKGLGRASTSGQGAIMLQQQQAPAESERPIDQLEVTLRPSLMPVDPSQAAMKSLWDSVSQDRPAAATDVSSSAAGPLATTMYLLQEQRAAGQQQQQQAAGAVRKQGTGTGVTETSPMPQPRKEVPLPSFFGSTL